MRWTLAIVSVLATIAISREGAGATSVRYALIVGNNFGRTPPGIELEALQHAEAEARALRDKLVQVAGFDASEERTVVVVGKGRREILDAAAALASVRKKDREDLGDVPTLFAFFFTGHGLSGQLLTADEPLTGSDLASLFNEIGATFTVGVFDACFSGSLDLAALSSKGLRLTPGFNAFDALPQEVIDAQGTMWFVSSRPDQVSYEDEEVGGVFTHYFMAALDRAPHAGLGVTLDEIWEYARSETQRHTSRAARPQTPQKLIRNLTSTGPLYFSFPAPRSAALAFEPSLAGRFLLRYENGQLSEVITKEAGTPLVIGVYPASIVLERLGGESGGTNERQHFTVAKGETVFVREAERFAAPRAVGSREVALTPKGGRLEGLVLTHETDRLTPMADLRLLGAMAGQQSGQSRYGVGMGFSLDYGWAYARLGYAYGYTASEYEAWRYHASRHAVELGLGPGLDLYPCRLHLGLLGRAAWQRVRYGGSDEAAPRELIPAFGAAADLLYLGLRAPLPLHVFGRLAVLAERSRPVAPRDAPRAWWVYPEVSAGVAVELGGD